MIKHAVPQFIAGRLDPQACRIEYATVPVDCGSSQGRAAVLFTSRDKAQRFIVASGRPDFKPVHLDYDHLRQWLEQSVCQTTSVLVVDVAGGPTPHPAIAFELPTILEAIAEADADSDVIRAGSFAVIV